MNCFFGILRKSLLGFILFVNTLNSVPLELEHLSNGLKEINYAPEELSHLWTARSNTDRVARKKASWTILVYMESENSLYNYAIRNIEDMVRANSSVDVNLIIQINKYKESKTHRLQVENHRLVDVGSFSQQMGLRPAYELDKALEWVAQAFPAEHTMVVLWNHGGGVNRWLLRPICWQDPLEDDIFDELSQGANLNTIEIVESAKDEVEPMDLSQTKGEKGILYNERTGAFLSTNDLGSVIDGAKRYFGKNLDILAMDACLMAMVEVCYAVKDSCDIVVASENLERGEGWNYLDILNYLSSNESLSPLKLSQYIVESYKNYYISNDPEFTQSAIWMTHIVDLKTTIDHLAESLLALKRTSSLVFRHFFEAMFANVIKYEKDYVDLGSICSSLKATCKMYTSFYASRPDSYCKALILSMNAIIDSVLSVENAIKKSVISSFAGSSLVDSCGISIYLPQIFSGKIVNEYSTSKFAKDSSWVKFLNSASRTSDDDDLSLFSDVVFPR